MNDKTPHKYLLIRGVYVPVDGGQTPERATLGSTGFDCFARVGGRLLPGERCAVPLGFKFEVQHQVVCQPGAGVSGLPTYRDAGSGEDVSENDSRIGYFDHTDVYQFELRPRSGLALNHGITLLNSPGTIDADYRKEVKAIVINHGDEQFTWKAGARICQAVWPHMMSWNRPHEGLRVKEDERFGGFGSTGVTSEQRTPEEQAAVMQTKKGESDHTK